MIMKHDLVSKQGVHLKLSIAILYILFLIGSLIISGTCYEIEGYKLVAKNILLKRELDIRKIIEIQIDIRIYSCFCASTEQLGIVVNNQKILWISPANQDDFLNLLHKAKQEYINNLEFESEH